MEAAAREGGGLGRPPRQATGAAACGVERITEGGQPPRQLSEQHRGEAKVRTLCSSRGRTRKDVIPQLPGISTEPPLHPGRLRSQCPLGPSDWEALARPPGLGMPLLGPQHLRAQSICPPLESSSDCAPNPSTHDKSTLWMRGEQHLAHTCRALSSIQTLLSLLQPQKNPLRKLRPKEGRAFPRSQSGAQLATLTRVPEHPASHQSKPR